MAVPWKFITEIVGVACAITLVVVCCIWMFKTIPQKNKTVNNLQLEVNKLERTYKNGVPDAVPEGEGEQDGEQKKEGEGEQQPGGEQKKGEGEQQSSGEGEQQKDEEQQNQ